MEPSRGQKRGPDPHLKRPRAKTSKGGHGTSYKASTTDFRLLAAKYPALRNLYLMPRPRYVELLFDSELSLLFEASTLTSLGLQASIGKILMHKGVEPQLFVRQPALDLTL